MPINKPKLPPQAGYVEVEINGVRQYVPTSETQEKINIELEKMLYFIGLDVRLSKLELGLEE